MRILCCLDGMNITQLQEAATTLLRMDENASVGLLYVTDSGPRTDISHRREAFFRPAMTPAPREAEMRAAEATAAQDILHEGSKYFPHAEILQREGRPEREIVETVLTWQADIVLICPRSPEHGGPSIGPRSMGHVARFVIDHAGCPVLLIRHTTERPPQPPQHEAHP